MVKVISAFPGTGKTYFFNNTKLTVLDSDSSSFSWKSKGVRHPEWPNNYVKHIVKNVPDVDLFLVSSHGEVRDALFCANWAFDLVYPARELKDEYLERFILRGSPPAFVELLNKKWDIFIDEMEAEDGCVNKHVLKSDQFISDLYGGAESSK